jgi:hypothetical protein
MACMNALDAVTMKFPEPCFLKMLAHHRQRMITRVVLRYVRTNHSSEVEDTVVVHRVDLFPVLQGRTSDIERAADTGVRDDLEYDVSWTQYQRYTSPRTTSSRPNVSSTFLTPASTASGSVAGILNASARTPKSFFRAATPSIAFVSDELYASAIEPPASANARAA